MRGLSFAAEAVAAVILLGGCVATVIGNAPISGTAADTRARSSASVDAALAGQVRSRLAADPALGGEPIEVRALNGTITLRGTVASSAARSSAERLVRTVAGVMTVNNRLKVK